MIQQSQHPFRGFLSDFKQWQRNSGKCRTDDRRYFPVVKSDQFQIFSDNDIGFGTVIHNTDRHDIVVDKNTVHAHTDQRFSADIAAVSSPVSSHSQMRIVRNLMLIKRQLMAPDAVRRMNTV